MNYLNKLKINYGYVVRESGTLEINFGDSNVSEKIVLDIVKRISSLGLELHIISNKKK